MKSMKCHFCNRNIDKRKYVISVYINKFDVCSECKYLYGIMHKQVEYKREKIVKELLELAKWGNRHCSLCIYFAKLTNTCKRGLETYLNRATPFHPHTYAFYGCSCYKITKK